MHLSKCGWREESHKTWIIQDLVHVTEVAKVAEDQVGVVRDATRAVVRMVARVVVSVEDAVMAVVVLGNRWAARRGNAW